MHKGIALSAAVEKIPNGSSLMIGGFMGIGSPHRLIDELVRQGLAECAVDPGDSRTAELNEVIGNCVGWMSANRRGHGQANDARVAQEALRHTLGYVDSYTSASDDLVDGRPAG